MSELKFSFQITSCRNCIRGDYCYVVAEAADIAPESYKRIDGELTSEEFARFKGEFCCALWEAKTDDN